MKIVFWTQRRFSSMRRKLVFGSDEVELIMVIATTLEAPPGLTFTRNKAVQASSQKGLKAGPGGVVPGEMILLECVCEETLRQVFCVFVVGLPFEANVLVGWFPIAREDSVESAPANDLIIAACANNGRVVGDRKPVKRS